MQSLTETPKEIFDFIKSIENYYGSYDPKENDPILKNYIIAYLKKYNPAKYGQLLMKIFETHPRSFGAPDIAAMYKAAEASPGDMRKENSKHEWKSDCNEPLTPEELKTAKQAHDNFLTFMSDKKLIKNVREVEKNCKDCQYRRKNQLDKMSGKSYQCMGCIDYSNFKSKDEK